MSGPSEPLRRGLGLLMMVGAAFVFAVLAPIGLLTLPLAALVFCSHPIPRRHRLAAALAGGISLWWLAQFGDPPDQVVRAAAVIGTAAFTMAVAFTSWSLIHRSLVAVATAAIGVMAFTAVLGTSWPEVRWWVESRIGVSAQIILGWLATSSGAKDGSAVGVDPLLLEDWFVVAVPLMADFFPATLAIQMLAGLALASVLYHRMTRRPRGTLGRFRDFSFTEHLGWAAVVALGIVLVARFATVKILAANVLVVAGVLYALRGAAVVSFALAMAGGPGVFTTVVIVLAILFMLPVVLPGTILLGVVDAGLDLRQRWSTPRART